MILLLLLLLASSSSQAQQSGQDEKTTIMAGIRAGLLALDDATKYQLEAEAAQDDPEESERKSYLAEKARSKANWELNLAIERTVAHYGIKPAGLRELDSKEARQGPMRGKEIRWDPEFVLDNNRVIKYTDAQGNERYTGGPMKPGDGGATWANGEVWITRDQFQMAVTHGHPGPLAYLIHHESVHFEEKVSREEDSLQAGEARAYARSAATAKVFGLDDEWVKLFTEMRSKNLQALRNGEGRSPYPTETEELKLKKAFESQQEELKNILWQAELLKHNASEARTGRMLTVVRSLSLTACRREVTSSNIPDTSIIETAAWAKSAAQPKSEPHDASACADLLYLWALEGLAQGKKLTADVVNQASLYFRKKASLESLLAAARACGYEPVSDGSRLVSYVHMNPVSNVRSTYNVDESLSADAIRAQLTLRRACHIVRNDRDLLSSPSTLNCAGGLETLTDFPFTGTVGWGSGAEESNCLLFTAQRISFPFKSENLQKLMSEVAKDIDVWRAGEEKGRERNAKIIREHEKRKNGDSGGGDKGGSQGRGGIDTKPAEDALDKAKKKFRP